MTYSLHRRQFLASSIAFASSLKAVAGQTPSTNFPKDIRHRLSVSTYPFRNVMISSRKNAAANAGKMTLQQFAATVVEKFNVYGIEPWSAHFESVEPAYIADLSAAFKKSGLIVVNIPCDVPVKLCGTPEQHDIALATYHKWVDAAKVLGSPSIRVHCPEGRTADDISCAVDGLKALAAYGAAKNIVINLENDDPGSEDPARIVKVLEAAQTPYLHALPDFCNSMQIHDDQDYNARALAELFKRAYNISHVKDVEIVDGRTLRVDVARIFAIARKTGYRGYFSMETEGSLDPYDGTKLLIDAALKGLG